MHLANSESVLRHLKGQVITDSRPGKDPCLARRKAILVRLLGHICQDWYWTKRTNVLTLYKKVSKGLIPYNCRMSSLSSRHLQLNELLVQDLKSALSEILQKLLPGSCGSCLSTANVHTCTAHDGAVRHERAAMFVSVFLVPNNG